MISNTYIGISEQLLFKAMKMFQMMDEPSKFHMDFKLRFNKIISKCPKHVQRVNFILKYSSCFKQKFSE